MKGINTLLGWLLMLAVLAVPSFLFYNWWSKNKAQSTVEAAANVPAAEVFPSAEKASPGMQPSAARTAGVPAAPASVSVTAAATQFVPGPAPERDAPSGALQPAAASAAEVPPSPPAVSSRPVQADHTAAQASTQPAKISYYSPKGERNPMLSPQDYANIKEAELERDEAARLARLNQTRKAKDLGIENKIHLQGIVGNAAIINGDMRTVGQSLYGGKLVKVGVDYIIMEYKGKTFRKNMQ